MLNRALFSLGLLASLSLLTAAACSDAPPEPRQVGSSSQAIFKDFPLVEQCGWPTAADFRQCSAVFVSDRVFLTAAHCIDSGVEGAIKEGKATVELGEGNNGPSFTVASCERHPNGEFTYVNGNEGYEGIDLAACTTVEPVGVPIVRVMVPGCESRYISERVYSSDGPPMSTAVGHGCETFGYGGHCTSGNKRSVDLPLLGEEKYNGSWKLHLDESIYDSDGVIMDGDSGGPLFFPMPDGSSRLIGVAHGGWYVHSYYESVPRHLRWIEQVAGDVTPCHSWSNTENRWVFDAQACEGVDPVAPFDGHGHSWGQLCKGPSDPRVGGSCGGWRPPGPSTLSAGASTGSAATQPPELFATSREEETTTRGITSP